MDEIILETVYELQKEIKKLRNEIVEMKATINKPIYRSNNSVVKDNKTVEKDDSKNNADGYMIVTKDLHGGDPILGPPVLGFFRSYEQAKTVLKMITRSLNYEKLDDDFSVYVECSNVCREFRIIPNKHNK